MITATSAVETDAVGVTVALTDKGIAPLPRVVRLALALSAGTLAVFALDFALVNSRIAPGALPAIVAVALVLYPLSVPRASGLATADGTIDATPAIETRTT